MKRIITLALALLMVLALASCGNTKSSDNSSTTKDDKVLKVGMECAYAPYNWSQATNANGAVSISGSSDYAYGYDIIIAKYLAEKIGYTLEVHKLAWDSLPTAVQSGAIDCAIAGQSITAERKKTLDFTTPYYYASIVALTKKTSKFAGAKGVADLKGCKVTSQLNTVWYDNCVPQIPNATVLPAMEGATDLLVALNAGSVDVVVTDMPTAKAALIAYPDFVLLDFSSGSDDFKASSEDVEIGVSVKKGNSDLLNKLNEALATLTKDDLTKKMDEAIAVQPLSKK